MTRLACLLLIVIATPTSAQLVASQAEDDRRIYKMTVRPAQQPTPRLANRLLFGESESTEGNAASYWYRSIRSFDKHLRTTEKKAADQVGLQAAEVHRHWVNPIRVPLAKLPIELTKPSRDLIYRFDIDRAARCRRCDWGLRLDSLRGPDVYDMHLSEWQGMRELSYLLCIDARAAIAEGRIDEALELLRLNTELSIDASAEPLLICKLIGKAIAHNGWDALRDLVCHPDAPCLYWALVDLPPDFLDRREALRYELAIGARLFELISEPAVTERSAEAWHTLFDQCLDGLAKMVSDQTDQNPPLASAEKEETLQGHLSVLKQIVDDNDRSHPLVKLAVDRLLKQGLDEKRLDEMPIARVLAIESTRHYRELSESIEAAYQVPFPEGSLSRNEATIGLNDKANPLNESDDREILPIAIITLPAYDAGTVAFIIHEREIAALRLVEALRLHAGVAGKLPTALDEVTIVPVPLNPATGKPFAYRLDGKTAIIDLPKSDGVVWVERYEVTLAE